ncbi:MAG: hypothetical protein FWG50_02755 [Kiritimatiellaeota bacterium]|nr:hypothetical protein [Kiritimatiellota bacterium]
MRGNIEAYKLWAPCGEQWTEWVKPVLFADMPQTVLGQSDVPELKWIAQPDRSAAVIVDLPGKEGVLEGMALARLGYRPIPLYNGVCGAWSGAGGPAAVPVYGIVDALCGFAGELPRLRLRADAPPAFLLDANRMKGARWTPGDYDNRWSVFPQDMPSAAYLQDKGLSRVIVRSDKVRDDLAHILRRYETQGLAILMSDGTGQKRITVPKPSLFKGLRYRFGVITGLSRNAAGGFGAQIPDTSDSGGRHYGFG